MINLKWYVVVKKTIYTHIYTQYTRYCLAVSDVLVSGIDSSCTQEMTNFHTISYFIQENKSLITLSHLILLL